MSRYGSMRMGFRVKEEELEQFKADALVMNNNELARKYGIPAYTVAEHLRRLGIIRDFRRSPDSRFSTTATEREEEKEKKKELTEYTIENYRDGGIKERNAYRAHQFRARAEDARLLAEETDVILKHKVALHSRSKECLNAELKCMLCDEIEELRSTKNRLMMRHKLLMRRAEKASSRVKDVAALNGGRKVQRGEFVERTKEAALDNVVAMLRQEAKKAYECGESEIGFSLTMAVSFIEDKKKVMLSRGVKGGVSWTRN